MFRNILIIADIDGSSGCWDRSGARFMTRAWQQACIAMSQDVDAVVRALFDNGVEGVHVVDFHRTAYNLLPHLIDRRARITQGYSKGPIPGIGSVQGADAVMFIGMHAASGTAGFLAHTLTSRIASLRVNGRLLSEVELFASVLAPFELAPLFFSGCPVACKQAAGAIPGIVTHPIDKSAGSKEFDAPSWRLDLAEAAVAALQNGGTRCPDFNGPIEAEVRMHDKAAASAVALRWNCEFSNGSIRFTVPNASELYLQLIRVCYLSPRIERFMGLSLFFYRLMGRAAWLLVFMASQPPSRANQCNQSNKRF